MRILFLLILFTVNLSAFTEVSGPVKGEWTEADSPYYVMDNIYIPKGSRLDIKPNVEVIFKGYYKFVIDENCDIKAVGEEDKYIIFTAENQEEGWQHIELHNSFQTPDTFKYCIFEYGNSTEFGGAMLTDSTDLTIDNCIFRNNHGGVGGGFASIASSINIIDTEIKNCTADFGGGLAFFKTNADIKNCRINDNLSSPAYGGGIYISEESNIYISYSDISNNNSENNTGGVHVYDSFLMLNESTLINNNACFNGGCITIRSSSCIIINNQIINNTADNGGGIYSYNAISPKIINNTITGNYARRGGGAYMKFFNSMYFTGNILSNNQAEMSSGGLYSNGSNAIIANNTIIGNQAVQDHAGGCLITGDENVNLYSNVIRGNVANTEGNQICTAYSPSFYNCNIEGGWEDFGGWSFHPDYDTYINCLDLPPNFADSANGDFSLTENSPCIDAGFPDTTGLFLPQKDIAGMPRISGENIDIGAFEFQQTDIADDILLTYYELSNSPNPFNPETVIRFYLERSCHVELSIYNVRGQKVATLQEGRMSEGFQFVRWRASDELGTGLYLAVLTASDKQQVKKMILLK